MKTVSIIVPIYNVEKYLKRCLDSIREQTLKNLEIILINDGSSDNSLRICQEYKNRDPRIKIINKKNEGVSVARNTGLQAAEGEYVGFVDPDDWIEPDMYWSLVKTIETHKCNIAFCNYSKDEKLSKLPRLLKIKKDVLGKREIINELIANMIGCEDILPKYSNIMGCVWRCLYKRKFISDNDLRFKPGIYIMEDLIFSIQALICSDRVCIDRGVRYHYMQNKSSALHSYNTNMWTDQKKVHDTLDEILADAGMDEYMKNRLDTRYIAMAACSMHNEMINSPGTMKEKLENVKSIMSDKKLRESLGRATQYNIEELKSLKHKEEISILLKQLSE